MSRRTRYNITIYAQCLTCHLTAVRISDYIEPNDIMIGVTQT